MPECDQKITDCLQVSDIILSLRTLAREQESFIERQRFLTAARVLETPETRFAHKSFDDELEIDELGFTWRRRQLLVPPQRLSVLRVLAENAGQLCRYERLIWDVYGDRSMKRRHIANHVKHLRAALRLVNAGLRIRSAYGAGYVLERIPT